MRVHRWMAGCTALALAATAWSPARAQTARRQVDWAAMNSAFAGATFVNDAGVCAGCHENVMSAFGHTPHARAFRGGRMPVSGECETCHGPRSAHVAAPGPEWAWARLSADQQSSVCQQCHEGGARMTWSAGAHRSANLSCTACHSVMAARSERALLRTARSPETCYSCHAEQRTQLARTSHHPVREGRMDCASCHNVHGSEASLLRTATVTETCTTCHAAQRGPFLWEHAPVRETCANCHEPHGSNNRNLLARKDSFLCLQCHSYGGHINLPRYNRTSNPYGSGCVNCHTSVHGSNHPSGAKLTR